MPAPTTLLTITVRVIGGRHGDLLAQTLGGDPNNLIQRAYNLDIIAPDGYVRVGEWQASGSHGSAPLRAKRTAHHRNGGMQISAAAD